MGKRIVITGPTGAVGMALIQKCIEEGDQVIAICHPKSARIANIPKSPKIRIIETDLSNLREAKKLIPETCDVFYHLAWTGTTGAARNDTHLQCKNMEYILDAVELASHLGCYTFIGAGSQAEYGRAEGYLQPQTPAFPENGYGMAKLCAGQMSRLKCEQRNMCHIWVRILSVYGPYDGENTMVTSTLKKLLSGEHAGFTPGEQIWDYLYSEDAAQALYLLYKKGKSGKTYVLGSGKTRRLKEYIYEMQKCVTEIGYTGGSIGLSDYPYADKQVMCLGADISELCADTGFAPQFSFEEGIRRTLEHVRSRG